MKVLIACEFSGIVREAFTRLGHYAVSCDFLETEKPGLHIQDDCRLPIFCEQWDLMIAHPPCTYLCVSGARWWKGREREQRKAIRFAKFLFRCRYIPMIALENPIGILTRYIGKPNQIIQPWMFGHGETKATCLWLKNLPELKPTNIVDGRENRIHRMPPGKDRGKERSRFYEGIAEAMAEQWGGYQFKNFRVCFAPKG